MYKRFIESHYTPIAAFLKERTDYLRYRENKGLKTILFSEDTDNSKSPRFIKSVW